MSILDDLADEVSAALHGELRAGALQRVLPGEPDGAGGTLPGEVVTFPFEGVLGSFGLIASGVADIPRDAGKIEVLASSLATEPKRGDKLTIEARWWLVREVSRDPAGAWWECQCESTAAPT